LPLHQTLGLQLHQRLADRGTRRLEAHGEIGLDQALTWQQVTVADGAPHVVEQVGAGA
jgi:hypothetical protein